MSFATGIQGLANDYEVLIIGGGITGAGMFAESCKRGYQTLLVESHDFASGTSSWSSKLVHGGLRYLKTGDWRLTRESVKQRQQLLQAFPDWVKPQAFLLPLYEGKKPSKLTMQAGLWLYDQFSPQHNALPKARFLSPAQTLAQQPELNEKGLIGAMAYFDAATDDCGLTLEVLMSGVACGGHARNGVSARINGESVHLEDGTHTRTLSPKVIVNATGVWVQGCDAHAPKVRPLRGSHLLFAQDRFPLKQAISWLHPQDGRPIFAYPWQGRTLYGTTDLDDTDPHRDKRISVAEQAYLLAGLSPLFDGLQLQDTDILSTFCGVRPIVDTGGKADPSDVSRESATWQQGRVLGITGGKLTTFQSQATRLLDQAARYLPKASAPVETNFLDCARAARQSGERIAGSDVRWGWIDFALEYLAVRNLSDLMLRRTRLGLLYPDHEDRTLARYLATHAVVVKGWSFPRAQQEIQQYGEAFRHFHGRVRG
jgi:glycerol-3-phosphate dehydrogenase